ncbi:MAG: glycosyltransferase family 4 protein [Myxococcota bacterium]
MRRAGTSQGGGSLRILQMGSTRYRGGVSVAIASLCRALAREGHAVRLVSDGGEEAERLTEEGVELDTLALESSPWHAVRGVPVVRRVIRRFRPDVVHVHGRAPSLACTLAGRMPDWFTLHNTHLTERVGWYDHGPVRRYLSPLGHRLFVLDERAAEYCSRELAVANSRVCCVPNGVDCDRFTPPTVEERRAARARFGVPSDATLVVFVGRFHPQKQPEAVVDLAVAAREAGLDHVRFALVGEGTLAPLLRRRMEDAELGTTCRLHGWMDPCQAYHAADLVVMPSRYEGYGLVAAEAMAAGCPVLRSRTGGFRAMVVEGVTGFGCAVDPGDFVRVGLRVLRDPARLAIMRPAATAHARSVLSVRRQAQQTIAAYRKALRAGAGPRTRDAARCS